jgi:hypothetical protein
MRMRAKRSVAIILAATLAIPSTAAAATPQTDNPAKAAAGWLARELTDQQRIELWFDGAPGEFPDMTARAVLDFDAAGVAQNYARNATAWLAEPTVLRGFLNGDGYTTSVTAHALIILVAKAQGIDPRQFGGVDVLAELRALRTPSGHFQGGPVVTSYDVIEQTMAILALDRAGGAPTSAVRFLARSQCPDGGFPSSFESASTPCQGDLLTTPWAIQALVAVGGHHAAVSQALDWLQAQQHPDGRFTLPGDTATVTGPAAVALAVGGRHAAARRAVAVLKAQQAGCANQPVDRGAIAENPGGSVSSGTSIWANATIGATLAAVPALARTDIADVSAVGARPQDPRLRCVASG